MPTTTLLILDACVLIDFQAAAPGVLAAVRASIGPIHVASAVLAEVDGLTPERALALGIEVIDPPTELLIDAAAARGRLSFPDRVCLLLAEARGWTCVSNDGALRRACAATGVPTLWGLETIAIAVEQGHLAADAALAAAESIAVENPFITVDLIRRFRDRIGLAPR